MQLHFDIDEDWLRQMDELGALGGLRTRKDLLNNALTILRWAAKQLLEGRTIVSVDAAGIGRERELEMPYLQTVAASIKKRNSTADLKALTSAA